MADASPSLAQLRAEIDEIDNSLLELLERRVGIGRRVAAAKGDASGPFLRPGREAQILRRLAGKLTGADLPVPVMERVWREILAANLARQVDPVTVVWAPAGAEALVDLARDRGGVSTRVEAVDGPAAALAAVAEGRATLAVLPTPELIQWRWWPLLLVDSPLKPRIIARLPLFGAPGSDALAGVGVGCQEPDPSGDDVTLCVVPGTVGSAVDTAKTVDGSALSLLAIDGWPLADTLPAGAVSIGAYARTHSY
ncbi:chorismate mutase [Thalassobaculum sp.]|uniref:chorismate mutase n=1 Tax=Thalassobaculum sp. TaxID=2022740 RepID=UPI0032EC80A3